VATILERIEAKRLAREAAEQKPILFASGAHRPAALRGMAVHEARNLSQLIAQMNPESQRGVAWTLRNLAEIRARFGDGIALDVLEKLK